MAVQGHAQEGKACEEMLTKRARAAGVQARRGGGELGRMADVADVVPYTHKLCIPCRQGLQGP
jgi:hypothetical protein